jgi:hypothetical protein
MAKASSSTSHGYCNLFSTLLYHYHHSQGGAEMKPQTVSPFVVGHVITPLLRPLPTLFAYAQEVTNDPSIIDRFPVLKEEFQAHIDCFVEMVEAATKTADIAISECTEVIRKARRLSSTKPQDLIRAVDQLDLELAHFSEVHKTALRHAYNMKPELYKDIYNSCIKACKLLLVYQSKSTEGVAKLEETLSERCYYDVKVVEEAYTTAPLRKADFVAFAPTEEPISSHTLDKIREAGIPLLVLVKLGANLQRADMVQTRLAGLYQKNGIPILHRPFPAIRLFQKIDRMIFEARLLREPVEKVTEPTEKTAVRVNA